MKILPKKLTVQVGP